MYIQAILCTAIYLANEPDTLKWAFVFRTINERKFVLYDSDPTRYILGKYYEL